MEEQHGEKSRLTVTQKGKAKARGRLSRMLLREVQISKATVV